MQRYILGRVIQALISMLVVSMVVFILVRLTGDPLDIMMPMEAKPEDFAQMRRHLGLDKPLPVQYWIFLSQAVQGDFGKSIRFKRPALGIVMERYPATLQLAGLAFIISLLIALPIGVYSAVRRGRALDYLGRGVAVLGQSAPNFWLGIMLIYIFGVWLNVLPTSGRDGLAHLILPAFTMGYFTTAGIMRLTRSAMLDVMGSEYIKLVRIKGLSELVVIWKHGLKNAALPVITFAGIVFVLMVNGSVIIETVFAWPGVGRLVIEAVMWRDYPVVQTVVLIFSAMFIGANLLTDIMYAYLNPKIRYR